MIIRPTVRIALWAACVAISAGVVFGQVSITVVPVGNAGNAPDPTTSYGSVSYSYGIGATEVTIAQYTAFLNAVAVTDANDLYSTTHQYDMPGYQCGIIRSGSPGSYAYSVVSGRENNPVNFVSFWRAARFANWMHNGQPTGVQDASTTEDGSYTLTAAAIANNTVARNPGATWVLPSVDEWYKAAYHQPASQGGDVDDYWAYPMQSNTYEIRVGAQYGFDNRTGNTAPVGSFAPNFYHAYDLGGNVWEWNDDADSRYGLSRFRSGGAFNNGAFGDYMRSTWSSTLADSRADGNNLGFRLALVPAPSSAAILGFGAALITRRRR